MHELTDKAKRAPRAYFIGGRWVGVGGPIVVKANPPKLPYIIREATPEEYLQIAENCPDLVRKKNDYAI